jgi:hypothetical protein
MLESRYLLHTEKDVTLKVYGDLLTEVELCSVGQTSRITLLNNHFFKKLYNV